MSLQQLWLTQKAPFYNEPLLLQVKRVNFSICLWYRPLPTPRQSLLSWSRELHSPTTFIPCTEYTIRHLHIVNLTCSHSCAQNSSTTPSLFVLWAWDLELTLLYNRSTTTGLLCKCEKRYCWQPSGFGIFIFQQRHHDIYFHYQMRECSEALPTKVRMWFLY